MDVYGHMAAIEMAIDKASHDGYTIMADEYSGALYLQGKWNSELERYDRYYLWEMD